MRLSLILAALMVLAALVMPAAADEIDDESVPDLLGDTETGTEGTIFSSQKIDDYLWFSPKVSPDSTRIAYVLKNDDGYYYYVIAGPEGKTTETAYEDIRQDSFVFSPDGKHHAYIVLN